MIFIGIIGNRNFGKSTIIQSLTGCQSTSYRGYINGNQNQKVYVCCSSPQERIFEFNGKEDIDAIIDIMSQITNASSGCRGMIIAIQPTNPHVRPSMERIYQEAALRGFTSIYGYVVDPGYHASGNIFISVQQRLQSINQHLIVSNISGIDFPFYNATQINNASHIIF